jgi:hypothetical protein
VEAIITPRYAALMGSMRSDIAPQATRTTAKKLIVRCDAAHHSSGEAGRECPRPAAVDVVGQALISL